MCIKAFIYKGFQKTKQQDISSSNTSKMTQNQICIKYLIFVFRPDVCAAAVKSDDSGPAHFDDLKLLHILNESVNLLAVTGCFDTDRFISEIDNLCSEDICRLNDICMLLFRISDLDKK